MRWLLVVLVLVGCGDPAAIGPGTVPRRPADFQPLGLTDPAFRAEYAAMEACAHRDGDFDRVKWFDARLDVATGWALWVPADEVYIDLTSTGTHWSIRFRDGALRHILRTNELPTWVRTACNAPMRPPG